MDCLLALWQLLFLVIPLVTVVIHLFFCSLPNFISYLKLPCITIYKLTQTWIKHPCSTRDLGPPTWIKHPCSTRDLGPPCPSFPFWLVLWRAEACWAHFPARALKTSSRGHPVPSWAVQALFKGFIGSLHKPGNISFFLFFTFLLSIWNTRFQSIKGPQHFSTSVWFSPVHLSHAHLILDQPEEHRQMENSSSLAGLLFVLILACKN